MKIDLSTGEIWDLLKQGTSNQRNFINSLRYSEFEDFLKQCEYIFEEYDLISLLNGGCLFVEDTPEEEEFIIWKNDRICIVLI